jgi:hypothetical protein
MATTETRTGFRLPWAAERTPSREAGEIDGPVAGEDDTTGGPDRDEPVPALEMAPAAPEPGGAPGDSLPAGSAGSGVPPEAGPAAVPVPTAGPTRRPTKFMADLMKAMHAAAEDARTASLEQFRTDGQAFVEQIHARAATQVEGLRRRTDDDVAEIKDWSKTEIARIREETEERITARRHKLDGQLERHAALVDREIDRIRGRVAAYETEMQAFFDRILAEEDPTFFASLAAQLPEPPIFEEIDDEALVELLNEPEAAVEVEVAAVPEAALEVVPEPEAVSEPETVSTDGAEATPGSVEVEPAAAPGEIEGAMAAIQAAAETAAAGEPAGLEFGGDEPVPAEPTAEAQADEPGVEPEATPEAEVDPRIAMLGLTPDFAAAEAEAAATASAYAGEGFDEMAEDSVSARLAGLVMPAGSDAAREPASTVTSQVVVVGLVSVASIASFKRHLGRLAGVTHVGVSSGPDGEFVYTVTHDPVASLADLVPTIPGFGARVTGAGEGIVNVSAGDPED